MRDLTDNDLLNIELRGSPTPEEMEELIRSYREDRFDEHEMDDLRGFLDEAERRVRALEDERDALTAELESYFYDDRAPETAHG